MIMTMGFIKTLQITNFRSYDSVRIDGIGAEPVVLYGANGAGKTNILEAISFLSPGRGLRQSRVNEIQNRATLPLSAPISPWAVSVNSYTEYGDTRIGTGATPDLRKRTIRINGEPAKSQSSLSEYLSCVWMTPQMDRIFMDSSSSRRRFLDRLVFAFDPSHSGRVTRYDNALGQRSKLLKENSSPDPVWLTALEKTIAETGIAIEAARLDFLERLQTSCHHAPSESDLYFPKAQLFLKGTIAQLLRASPALEVEEMFRYQLKQTRPADALTGGAATGAHKSDLHVSYIDKKADAAQCSTGEQKALLIGIILAHSRLLQAERGSPPIILLDEVAAHLDENRRAALYDQLLGMKAQFWLTGTDKNLFESLDGRSAQFHIHDGKIHHEKHQNAA